MISFWEYIDTCNEEKNEIITGTKFLELKEQILTDYSSLIGQNLLTGLFMNFYFPLCIWISDKTKTKGSPAVIGISGAQGTGKTTLTRICKSILTDYFRLNVAAISIDDFYLTRNERRELAEEVHPLFETRGVPGTHDTGMAIDLIRSLKTLKTDQTIKLPVFDKGADDRMPENCWKIVNGDLDVIIFEGWCVGARPQRGSELIKPVNSLESQQDKKCIWRKFVNNKLKNEYKSLFSEIDFLIYLCAPGFEKVYEWRVNQEKDLSAHLSGIEKNALMSDSEIKLFIMYYERLTKHMINTLPSISDITVYLNDNHLPGKFKVPAKNRSRLKLKNIRFLP